MAANTYSLDATVSFLESVLGVVGHAPPAEPASTREALRKRFRKLKRLYEKLERDVWPGAAPMPSAPDAVVVADFYVSSQPLFVQGSYAMSTRVSLLSGGNEVDEVASGWATPPFLGGNALTQLDVALRFTREGPESFFDTVMAYWARRHDVVVKPGSPDKRPERRFAITRLFQALMRFVFGFFGNHKVDARNNP